MAGAPGSLINGVGAAYVFVKPASGWANMTQTAKLTASDGQPGDLLGSSVAISGSTVALGAPHATDGGKGQRGAAYVFVEPADGWVDMTETAKLTASDRQDFGALGSSVAVSANTVIAGAPSSEAGGTAYVFVMPNNGWVNSAQTAKLTATDKPGDLGASVSLSGSTVVAGAPNLAATYVFVKPQTGWVNLNQTAKLTDPGLHSGNLGFSVSVDGNTVVAGAYTAGSSTRRNTGAAYVFVEPLGGWVNNTPNPTLTASDPFNDSSLGYSVSISGNTVLAGAPAPGTAVAGTVYIFVEPRVAGSTRPRQRN